MLVGELDHVSALMLGAGLLAAAGLRRDRDAWRWRAGLAGAFGAWLVLWGPQFVDQTRAGGPEWVPPTSLHGIVTAVGRIVVFTSGSEGLAFVAVLVGGVCLWRWNGGLGRVALYCFWMPAALVVVIGFFAPILIERTLTFGAWAPLLGLAAISAEAARRWRPLGSVAAVLVLLLVLPSAVSLQREQWEADGVARHLGAVVRAGDRVAAHPQWWLPLAEWGVRPAGNDETCEVREDRFPDTRAVKVGTAPATGRWWLAERVNDPLDTSGFEQCRARGPTARSACSVSGSRRRVPDRRSRAGGCRTSVRPPPWIR